MEGLSVISKVDYSQRQIDKTLTWGVVFSVMWIWRIGSLVAIVCGLKARTMILASDERRGIIRMYWCLLVGGIGLVWMAAITTIIIFKII